MEPYAVKWESCNHAPDERFGVMAFPALEIRIDHLPEAFLRDSPELCCHLPQMVLDSNINQGCAMAMQRMGVHFGLVCSPLQKLGKLREAHLQHLAVAVGWQEL